MQPQNPLEQQPPQPIQSQPSGPQAPDPASAAYLPRVPYDRDDENDGMPQPTYYTRPVVPAALIVPPEIQEKHEKSKKMYPMLNLSEGEYVVGHVRRHPIALVKIWGLVALGITLIIGSLFFFSSGGSSTLSDTGSANALSVPPALLALVSIVTIVVAALMGMVGTWVHRANNMYLTNESVTQNIQMTPFANRKQTVSLGNIEDASFAKPGILATIFDYGEIRLSTEGDETTYRFPYAINPDKQVALLNDAIEAFKNGRPIQSA